MIVIGEKINGSIPSVGKAIAGHDEEFIKKLAKLQSDCGADYIDCCASVSEAVVAQTLEWMIKAIEDAADTPVCVDRPSPEICVEGIGMCSRPGIVNSVSMEGNKTDVIFPVIADTKWNCIALLCDDTGIPKTPEKRIEVFKRILEEADKYGISHDRLFIDPLVVTLSTDEEAFTTFADTVRQIKEIDPDVHITSGLSNISFGLPKRRIINQAFMILAAQAGMDSAIMDPSNQMLTGAAYAADALLGNDEYCMEYIGAYRDGLFGE